MCRTPLWLVNGGRLSQNIKTHTEFCDTNSCCVSDLLFWKLKQATYIPHNTAKTAS